VPGRFVFVVFITRWRAGSSALIWDRNAVIPSIRPQDRRARAGKFAMQNSRRISLPKLRRMETTRRISMSRVSMYQLPVLLAFIICGMAVSKTALADCCPGGGHGAPKAASGLGESSPATVDLAADPAWRVYEFEKDGIQYVQVNDQYGNVRTAVGRIGRTFWVLPIGGDVDRVADPADGVPPGTPKVLYRSSEVEVLLYQDGTSHNWVIRPASASQ
jgi:hypothetical protein